MLAAPMPTATKAGQRSFWKYVSTATASASSPAPMKYRIGVLPAPGS